MLQQRAANTFYGKGDAELAFTSSYEGATCAVAVAFQQAGMIMHALELEIPINRTKLKWKQVSLEADHTLYYRSLFERNL